MKLQDWCEENGVAPRWLESENRSARVPLRHPIPPGPTVGEGYADIGLWHLEDYRIVGFGRSGDGSRTSAVLERVGIPERSFLGLLAEIKEVITANARRRAREYEEMYGFPPRVRYIEKDKPIDHSPLDHLDHYKKRARKFDFLYAEADCFEVVHLGFWVDLGTGDDYPWNYRPSVEQIKEIEDRMYGDYVEAFFAE